MMSPAKKPDSADDDKRAIGRFREGFADPAVILRRRRRQHSAGDLPSSLSPEWQESALSGPRSRLPKSITEVIRNAFLARESLKVSRAALAGFESLHSVGPTSN